MTDGAEGRRFSGVGWLSSHLSRKLLLALVAAAVLSWGLMCGWFLSYLGDYAGNTYDGVMRAADGAAQRVGAFLEGCGGDFAALEDYLEDGALYCIVRDADGTLLYERMPAGEAGTRLLASGEQEAALSEGRRVHVYVWSRAIQRNELSADLQKKALRGLSGLNIGVFTVVAV